VTLIARPANGSLHSQNASRWPQKELGAIYKRVHQSLWVSAYSELCFDVRRCRLQERLHLQDGVVTWSTALTTNGTDAVDTIFFPKVHVNVSVRHLLALMTIRPLIYCGDILRQSAAELASSITFIHHTQSPRERQITRGEFGQRGSGYPRGHDTGGLALCSNGKRSTCLNRPAYNIPTGDRRDTYNIPSGLFDRR
jgi:hypothetical protein